MSLRMLAAELWVHGWAQNLLSFLQFPYKDRRCLQLFLELLL